jgi:putative transcriptional regulator
MGKFFEKIKKGLEEAIEYEEGKKTLRSKLVVMPKPPRLYSPREIQKIRTDILNCSQPIFASVLGVSVKTVQAWETGERSPSHTALRLLELIENGTYCPNLEPESIKTA